MIDWRGHEIKPGDTVVYPGRTGSSLWLNEGIAVEVYADCVKVMRRPGNQFEKERLVTVRSHFLTKVAPRV